MYLLFYQKVITIPICIVFKLLVDRTLALHVCKFPNKHLVYSDVYDSVRYVIFE